MTREERTKLVFETISKIVGFEIKPDKPFYMIANEAKEKYIIDEYLIMWHVSEGNYLRKSPYNILPIFNGGFQLEEIKEPLLTEEEKKLILRLGDLDIESLVKDIHNYLDIKLYNTHEIITMKIYEGEFKGLELNKEYSGEDLGLEEVNNE